jgi:hypothetical protein
MLQALPPPNPEEVELMDDEVVVEELLVAAPPSPPLPPVPLVVDPEVGLGGFTVSSLEQAANTPPRTTTATMTEEYETRIASLLGPTR